MDSKVYDTAIIGGGMVGLCLARDIASVGFETVVLEAQEGIGGVWRVNDYPKLRLHGPGAPYRCLSLAPSWHQHPSSDNYRPYRQEIWDYINKLTDHPKINIKTNHCYTQHHWTDENHWLVECKGGQKARARSIIFSLGYSLLTAGQPVFPLNTNKLNPETKKTFFHSAEINKETWKAFLNAKNKLILGSGKAALEILSLLEPGNDILWAHRGHTAFFDRDFVNQVLFMDNTTKKFLFKELDEQVRQSRNSTTHWSESGLERGELISCGPPYTKRRNKCNLGIVNKQDLKHAADFKQILLDKVEIKDGEINLVLQNGSTLVLDSSWAVIACTGYRNPNWGRPIFNKNGISSIIFISGTGPVNTLIPLSLTIDYLRGNFKPLSQVSERINKDANSLSAQGIADDRDWAEKCATYYKENILGLVFADTFDPTFRSEWVNEWYGKDLDVTEVLAHLSNPE